MVCILISYLKDLCEVGKGTVLQSSNFELQSLPQLPQANWSLLQMPTNTLYVPTSQPSQARIQAPPTGGGCQSTSLLLPADPRLLEGRSCTPFLFVLGTVSGRTGCTNMW